MILKFRPPFHWLVFAILVVGFLMIARVGRAEEDYTVYKCPDDIKISGSQKINERKACDPDADICCNPV